MIHTPKNSRNKNLVDANGKIIPFVASFDDETNEATIYLTTKKSDCKIGLAMMIDLEHSSDGTEFRRKPVLVTVTIPGARLVDILKEKN